MKSLIFTLILLAFYFQVLKGQTNLVNNPSIEDTLRCPKHKADIYAASHFYQPNPAGSSTDYFHPCDASVWNTMIIGQNRLLPRTGVAYSLIATAGPKQNSYPGRREYLCGRLTQPLKAQQCYNIQFYIVPAVCKNYPTVGMNRIGIWFSTDTIVNPYPLGILWM